MAPVASSPPFDLRTQIIENCQFFSRPDADVTLVIAKEPLGTFKVIVLRAEDGTRDVLLSETAASFYDALQALHVKSAEAVQNYIASNGFAFVPSGKKQKPKLANNHDDVYDSDSASSTVTLGEACESLSDNETVSVSSVDAKRLRRKTGRPTRTKTVKSKARRSRSRSRSPSSTRRARSRSCSSSSSESEHEFRRETETLRVPPMRPPFLNNFPHRMPPRPPQNSFPGPPRPPGPLGPPGWTPYTQYPPGLGHSLPPPPPGRNSNPIITNPHLTTTTSPPLPTGSGSGSGSEPKPASNPNPTTRPQVHDILLQINWFNHGSQRTLEQLTGRVTIRDLQFAALAFVQRQARLFDNVSPADTLPRSLCRLRASVKNIAVAGATEGGVYDVSGYAGQDLTGLVALLREGRDNSEGGLLRVEVEVRSLGVGVGPSVGVPPVVGGMPPPPPPPPPTAAAAPATGAGVAARPSGPEAGVGAWAAMQGQGQLG